MPGENRFSVQDLLTRGIDAWSEIQVARYAPNDPRPNTQTASGQSVPAGQSAVPLSQLAKDYAPAVLLALGGLALVFWLARR